MDPSCRKLFKIKWVLSLFLVAILLYLGGCASTGKGGAGIYVDEECNGLNELGYKAPFSAQDIKDIEALGFYKCAEYIKNLP